MTKRAVTYRRVSQATETNVTGSIEDQLAACQRLADELGAVIVGDYCEIGKSAYTENPAKRPEFARLLADAKAGLFDVVLVYKLDRFSRKTRLGLQCRADLEVSGVTIASASEKFDNSAGGRFAARTMLSVAELFSDMQGERISARRQAEASSGRHLGHAPMGYTHAGRGQLSRLAPYDGLVVQALELYSGGSLSAVRIAEALNRQRHATPAGRPIIAEDVRRMIELAPFYSGQVKAGGAWIDGAHEALITPDLAARVASVAHRRSRPQGEIVRTQDSRALLAGLCYCERCRAAGQRSKMHYAADHRMASGWHGYRCVAKRDALTCEAPYALGDPVHVSVLKLCDVLALPETWLEEALSLWTPPPAVTVDRPRIEERIKRLGRLYADGLKDDREYTTELAALRAQLQQAPPVPRINLVEIAAYLSDLPTLIRRGTVAEQRAVLRELLSEVYLDRRRVAAFRPTELYAPLIRTALSVLPPRQLSASYNADDPPPLILPAYTEVR